MGFGDQTPTVFFQELFLMAIDTLVRDIQTPINSTVLATQEGTKYPE
ncbi:MAG: hypothetical protein AAGJ08_09805 [Cyanobacteria bacterium P01_H01_bin.35]